MSKRITMDHIREANFCVAGLKPWCAENGVDLRKLVREGIPLDELNHVDDAHLDIIRENMKDQD